MNELITKIEELTEALQSLRRDAMMAISGEWDKTDQGFFAQIELINEVIGEEDQRTEWELMQELARVKMGCKPKEGTNADWCGSFYWPINHSSDYYGLFLQEFSDDSSFHIIYKFTTDDIEPMLIMNAHDLNELKTLLENI
jgi:hypothetical protein